MNLTQYTQKLRSLKIEQIASASVDETKTDLLTQNKRQLYAGKTKDGSHLQAYRSSDYAFYKVNRNPIPGLGNPDLFDTGDYYRSWTIAVRGKQIVDDATDPKASQLREKYGDRIRGLGGLYKSEYIDNNLRPVFLSNIKNELQ